MPLSPPGKCWGELRLCKIQMHHLLGMPVSEIPTFSHAPKILGICEGDLTVNVHNSVHAYGEWSNSPHTWGQS